MTSVNEERLFTDSSRSQLPPLPLGSHVFQQPSTMPLLSRCKLQGLTRPSGNPPSPTDPPAGLPWRMLICREGQTFIKCLVNAVVEYRRRPTVNLRCDAVLNKRRQYRAQLRIQYSPNISRHVQVQLNLSHSIVFGSSPQPHSSNLHAQIAPSSSLNPCRSNKQINAAYCLPLPFSRPRTPSSRFAGSGAYPGMRRGSHFRRAGDER